mmetsp:Transcript_27805/g.42127  ORF Transcript_27805/g.42127 Transcript_27805/m.42127 type:complete len:211 (-) Transcript_27805:7-639(-)|eukprot:CAMPEP_0206457366 /NCGR_PEP_ID=MMETSP0324_2-20121206/22919_1 /ASSEMBLY_ACC=CAM_ASM_000836 /TAXON_ID=2866 /ORGANISM="Crypthecodinium cohnii, Strain Seligo" /LENGTH=210 /DNA_ID=CAMNT_0053928475 /DNA_START=777 /DNA_END=1409 /DNA_ORIENTATION=+
MCFALCLGSGLLADGHERRAQGEELAVPGAVDQDGPACVECQEAADDANVARKLVDGNTVLADGQQEEQCHHEGEHEDQGLVQAEGDDPDEHREDTPGAEIDGEVDLHGASVESALESPSEGSQADPEGAIGAEGRRRKEVAGRKFPHSSNELGDSSEKDGMCHDQVGQGRFADAGIREIQQNAGHAETKEAKRSARGDHFDIMRRETGK